MAKKIVIDVPDDMYEALKDEKDRTDIPVASQVRVAIQRHLAKKGKKVSSKVGQWGGKRDLEPTTDSAMTA